MAAIPIKKLKDGAISYYPLSVGESVVTTHDITVGHDIGNYKTGEKIDKLATVDSILTNMIEGTGSSCTWEEVKKPLTTEDVFDAKCNDYNLRKILARVWTELGGKVINND